MTSTLNAGIDVIWDTFQPTLETLRKQLNAALGRSGFNPTLHSDSRAEARPTSTLEWQEWEIPREADAKWPDAAKQAHKENKIDFIALEPWPGKLICAEGRFIQSAGVASDTSVEGADKKRAAIFIGSEFGTVTRVDLAAAAREAAEADFDVLIACAFSFDAHASELGKLGRIRVLQARMNADPHMAEDLKNTGKGNLFVIFGEPDITILDQNQPQIRVEVNGVDVFHPNSGEIRIADAFTSLPPPPWPTLRCSGESRWSNARSPRVPKGVRARRLESAHGRESLLSTRTSRPSSPRARRASR